MLSPHADDDMPMNALLPFMLGALNEAEDAVEVAGGGVVEAAMRARVLPRDLEDLGTALGGGGDGGYWMGRVARLQREAALVEEAGQRGGDEAGNRRRRRQRRRRRRNHTNEGDGKT